MTTIPQHGPIVATKLPPRVPDLITAAHAIVAGMTGNAYFPTPNPPLATLTAAITTLDTAETATKTRARGTVAARNTALNQLTSDLRAAKAYVQQIADANPEEAEAIIASAGMTVRKPTSHSKANFAARQGLTSGSVKLTVRAAALRAAYEWEWSADGGKTWTMAAPTLQSQTEIDGLPVGTTVLFRYRAITKTGPSDWSQPTSLLVT